MQKSISLIFNRGKIVRILDDIISIGSVSRCKTFEIFINFTIVPAGVAKVVPIFTGCIFEVSPKLGSVFFVRKPDVSRTPRADMPKRFTFDSQKITSCVIPPWTRLTRPIFGRTRRVRDDFSAEIRELLVRRHWKHSDSVKSCCCSTPARKDRRIKSSNRERRKKDDWMMIRVNHVRVNIKSDFVVQSRRQESEVQ